MIWFCALLHGCFGLSFENIAIKAKEMNMKKLIFGLFFVTGALQASNQAPAQEAKREPRPLRTIQIDRAEIDRLPANHPMRLAMERLDAFERAQCLGRLAEAAVGMTLGVVLCYVLQASGVNLS